MKQFPVNCVFHKGSIKEMYWKAQPIGLYVDDATKVAELWAHAVETFWPYLIPQKTHLVLMDFRFYEKAGEKYAAQKFYMAAHERSFELVEDRLAGTSAAVFRYLG